MKYDVIVVGSGSAGSVVATRLAQSSNRSILLIEAGPDYPDYSVLPEELKYAQTGGADVTVSDEHNWNFTGIANNDAREVMSVPRGRVTGGTSAINGQVFMRGLPEDFERWVSWGNPDWNYKELIPYFRKLETDRDFSDDFHGTDGPVPVKRFEESEWQLPQLAFHRACVAAGYKSMQDINNPDAFGVGPFAFNNINGIRMSSALTYLSQVRHCLNLTIRADCTVHSLIIDRNCVKGVVVESGGEKYTVEADLTVLSAGAICNPKILMLSGVGPEDHLKDIGVPLTHPLKGVGENLSDHPMNFVTSTVKDDFVLDPFAPRLGVALRYSSESSLHSKDMLMWMQSFATERANRGGDRMTPVGIRIVVSVYLATSKGCVKLRSPDPTIQPDLYYNLLETSEDLVRMREGVRSAVRMFETPEFESLVGDRFEPPESVMRTDELLEMWLRREVTTAQHITGTCKMGPSSDPWAVVDQYGKVHGLDGLAIADASIMPDSVRANTNATTMMIGERIADIILGN